MCCVVVIEHLLRSIDRAAVPVEGLTYHQRKAASDEAGKETG